MGGFLNMVEKFKRSLCKFSSPAKAKILQGFFKTGKGEYGEGDVFLGIVVPDIRRTVKVYWKEMSLDDVVVILHSSFHEERLAALLILVEKYRHGSEGDKKKIFEVYLKNIKKYINNWDLVDLTAPHIVGGYLKDKDNGVLVRLARSKNLWERRVAILSTFNFIYSGECLETIKIAKILILDKQDLIHKAVGWMLREVGKRCSVKVLEGFLKEEATRMPRTMLRYSIERLPEERRLFWLRYKKKE